MNILLINHYAGSDRMGMEYRPFYLSREWATLGHCVTIVAADRSHLRHRQPEVPHDLTITEEEGVRYLWIRSSRYNGNGAARIANILGFVGKLHVHADRIAREQAPDVVICSSTYPLDIYPGARIARKRGARLLFEVHDLWPLTPILLGGYSPRHPYVRVLQRAEDFACRNADLVVSILPHALDHLAERGLDAAKYVHIPNGVAIGRVGPRDREGLPAAVDALIMEERRRGRFLIGFAGGLNMSMAVETLVDAARLLATAGVSFVIAGDGPRAASLRARAAEIGGDNFHMVGQIPKGAVPDFLARADVLAIPFYRSPLYRFGTSPNKLFDYMLAAKPIVQAADASNDVVSEAGCGVTVAPEDPAALAGAILQMRAMGETERQRLGKNGHRFVLQNHDHRVLATRFLEAISDRSGGSSTAPRNVRSEMRPAPT